MKRNTLLVRRTPLAPGKPLRPRSARRAREYAAPGTGRRALVQAFLAAFPVCQAQVCCRGGRAVDVHERLSRARGGRILDLDQSHAVTVCRACHDWVTTHPAEAEARRLLLPSWHRCPPVGPC